MIDAQGHAEAEAETLDKQKLITELLMMQLRLVEGLSIEGFRGRIGLDPGVLFKDALTRLTGLGFITVSDTRVALPRQGRLIGNAVITELVTAAEGYADRLEQDG